MLTALTYRTSVISDILAIARIALVIVALVTIVVTTVIVVNAVWPVVLAFVGKALAGGGATVSFALVFRP